MPGRTADNLSIEPVALPFEVPENGEVDVTTSAQLVDDADTTCRAATLPLTFTGTATKP